MVEALGHAYRRWPLEAYLTGLLLPEERKSVDPIAARVEPGHVGWRIRPCNTSWRCRRAMSARCGASRVPKKGRHSVGVAR